MNLNLISLLTQENLTNNRTNLGKSLNKLSSGLRITKASDDASGIAISDKLRTHASSIKQSIANANSAVSLLQTTDKAMAEISNIHDIIKQKLIQASTSTTSNDGRKAIKKDIDKLINQIDNIVNQTTYNDIKLLCHNGLDFQIGANASDIIDLGNINLGKDCVIETPSNETPTTPTVPTSIDGFSMSNVLARSDWMNDNDTLTFTFGNLTQNISSEVKEDNLFVDNSSLVYSQLSIDSQGVYNTLDMSVEVNQDSYLNYDNNRFFEMIPSSVAYIKPKDNSTRDYFMNVFPNDYNVVTDTFIVSTSNYTSFRNPSVQTSESLNFYLSSNDDIQMFNLNINSMKIAPDNIVGLNDTSEPNDGMVEDRKSTRLNSSH